MTETCARTEVPEGLSRSWAMFALVGALGVALFVIRLAAPSNFLDQDQERPAAYVLDAVKNGHWICQRDLSGDISSKPPLYTWLCGLITLGCGRISLFALDLPGALAALGSAWLVLGFGRKYFSASAGVLAALALMLTPASLKQFGLARTDGVFAFTVTAAALLAFRAWQLGRGWHWFWLLASAATLTKGPLGVVLAGAGLLASRWERKAGEPLPLRGSQLTGLALFFLITGGWFLLAYWQFGDALIAKMIGKELVGHALSGKKAVPGAHFYQPPLYYLGRAAPWSLLAYYGIWRVWKHPALNPQERRFERFLFCWFLGGLALFSLAPHQRADLLWPLLPAGALLAGRELSRFTQRLAPKKAPWLTTAVTTLIVFGFGFYYFRLHARQPVIQQTIALQKLSHAIEQNGGNEFPLTYVDAPTALQVYLNTLRPPVPAERAAELLRGPDAAFIAVRDVGRFKSCRKLDDPPMFTLFAESENAPAAIIGNRPKLDASDPFVFCFGSLLVRASGVSLIRSTEREFCFNAMNESAEVLVTNESLTPRKVCICLKSGVRTTRQTRPLAAQESWKVSLAPGAL